MFSLCHPLDNIYVTEQFIVCWGGGPDQLPRQTPSGRKVRGRKKQEEKKEKNNAKFSGHYVCPRTHNVRAHALPSHQSSGMGIRTIRNYITEPLRTITFCFLDMLMTGS